MLHWGYKAFRWDAGKNEWLKVHRRVSFELVLPKLERGDVLDIVEHVNKERYPNQRIFIVDLDGYAYLVPFVETEEEIFLKTLFASRRATKRYLRQGHEHG